LTGSLFRKSASGEHQFQPAALKICQALAKALQLSTCALVLVFAQRRQLFGERRFDSG
jgi:hypothetical protein